MSGQHFTPCRADLGRDNHGATVRPFCQWQREATVAQARLSMRKIREVLRLDAAGLTDRAIAASVGSSRSTVQECLKRARAAGITWPLPEDLDERALEARLYPRAASRPGAVAVEPDFAEVARELGRKHMTRRQVWREYRKAHPTGLGYTAFCVHFRLLPRRS